MRKYQEIWHNLKKDNHCSIAVHPSLHARVIKAVINEKDRDIGYKLTALPPDEINIYMIKLAYKRNGAMIKFFLRKVLLISRITGKDVV